MGGGLLRHAFEEHIPWFVKGQIVRVGYVIGNIFYRQMPCNILRSRGMRDLFRVEGWDCG